MEILKTIEDKESTAQLTGVLTLNIKPNPDLLPVV